jgi:hypothetical protein
MLKREANHNLVIIRLVSVVERLKKNRLQAGYKILCSKINMLKMTGNGTHPKIKEDSVTIWKRVFFANVQNVRGIQPYLEHLFYLPDFLAGKR